MEKGDLLVAMTEQAAGLLGSPILVPESNKFLHNQRLGLVTKKPDIPWTNEFFFHVFNTRRVRKEIHDSASGVKVQHTSPKNIGDVVDGLAESGFGKEQLAEMQKLASAEKSDLFDVLAFVAYSLPPLTRQQRADQARAVINGQFPSNQELFIEFVLAHYVEAGVDELDLDKLSPLLRLKYHSIADAVADLGRPEEINRTFASFQRYLYEPQTAA